MVVDAVPLEPQTFEPTRLPREGYSWIFCPNKQLPKSFKVPDRDGSMECGVPWDPAPYSASLGEAAPPPQRKKERREIWIVRHWCTIQESNSGLTKSVLELKNNQLKATMVTNVEGDAVLSVLEL
jgi:hypothetical protein